MGAYKNHNHVLLAHPAIDWDADRKTVLARHPYRKEGWLLMVQFRAMEDRAQGQGFPAGPEICEDGKYAAVWIT
ncbi:hypothetical protein ACQEVF_14975 [Nonomuraea polychroma]|uniref:hypothetical protein n=1 Tax=Nonomuraea polychroma TaxID=46176 RepID=UPI003D8B2F1F